MEPGRHNSKSPGHAAAGHGLHVLLCSSLLLNALFLARHFVWTSPPVPRLGDDDAGGGLGWALKAAREAEAVAAVDCSGHGSVFLDGIVVGVDGRPGCECNQCFAGPDCSVRTPNCTVDADGYTSLLACWCLCS
ncbi:hypothetical protein GUJ93_ZPchr0001g31807 [Zizania palustris]|uniref:Alliinase EGF-like domain-containing protein n=1 Tax=Zizania palustris TaxID=103762 RepID=A0A8J5S069_ZIZPA|nr:hypothetical protein GUJ93_ZPchr0001g31807 [Zizania palustris]